MTAENSRPDDVVDAGEAFLPTGKLPGPVLDRLITTYRTRHDPTVVVGPGYGKDAAAISFDAGAPLVVKSDPITFTSTSAARYLVAVNANDIVCLGAVPRWLTAVALFPAGATTVRHVEEVFSDLQAACHDHGISLVGGHTEVTAGLDHPLLVGTLIGMAGPHGLLVPGGARPGDDLLLTKWAGIEGTALLARELREKLEHPLGVEVVARAAKLLRHPGISIIADAEAVRSVEGVTALHDPTEGGIATAIHELAEVSGCGAEVMVESVPLLAETRLICEHLRLDPMGLLSSGALLAAVRPDRRRAVEAAAARSHIPIAHIGHLVPQDEGVRAVHGGGSSPLPRFDADEVTRALSSNT